MQSRAPGLYLLDERTRLAGCHMIRDAVERLVLEEGERALQAVHARGDRGRPARLQVPRARPARPRPLPLRRLHRGALREQDEPAEARPARPDHARRLRGGGRPRRPLDHRPARLLGLGLALLQRDPGGPAGDAVDPLHPDADLQRQDQRRRLLRDRAAAHRGQLGRPRRRALLVLVPLDADVHAPRPATCARSRAPCSRAATSRRSSAPTPSPATSPRAAASTSTGRSPAS